MLARRHAVTGCSLVLQITSYHRKKVVFKKKSTKFWRYGSYVMASESFILMLNDL